MSSKSYHMRLSLFMRGIAFSIGFVILVLGGCAPTSPGPGPGEPDEMQLQHFYMLKSAIEEKNKVNALVALDLFEGDVFRWYTNKSTEAQAITELKKLTDAVDKEEWDSAGKILDELVSKYRPEGE